jgi:metal-dependent amidase/aminoacylase/carboxypeptidase family protein
MTASPLPPSLLHAIDDAASAMQGRLVATRRRLHAHPELGLELPRTQRLILD